MDPTQLGLLSALIVLILLSAYFSSTETAFSVVNKVRLRTLEAKGNKNATHVLAMLDNYDQLLSTVLIGNNIVNISSATIATLFFTNLISGNSAQLGATISTIVMTVVVLIFGEVSPKIIAKQHSEKFVLSTWRLLKIFTIILWPLDILLLPVKKLVNRIFKKDNQPSITESDLITYVQTAADEGGIDEHERQLIRSAIEFEDRDIDDIMCARVNIVAVEQTQSIDSIANMFFEHGFSRMPVYSDSVDNIVGVLHEKDFFKACTLSSGGVSIADISQSAVCLSHTMSISNALRHMQKTKAHMAIVVDEFGGTSGIVTMEDILEELVGEIWDEHDEVEVSFCSTEDNCYSVAGNYDLQQLFEQLDIECLENFQSTTVGGWVSEQLCRMPLVGDSFVYNNLSIVVARATNKLVLEVNIRIIEPTVNGT